MRGFCFGVAAAFGVTTTLLSAPAFAQHGNQTASVAERYVAQGTVPGIVIAVGAGDAAPVITARGRIGAAADSAIANEDSLWRVYSMTKPITGIAAMILIDQGKLKLDQPISDFIPAFKDMKVLIDPAKGLESRPAKGPITVRHLLTHTAGLGYNIITRGPLLDEYNRLGINPAQVSLALESAARRARPASLEEFANRVATLPLLSDPGAKWSYSIGLDLLGRVIEVASGESFEQFVSTRIFQPLKMQATYWTVPADKQPILADNFAAFGGTRVVMDPSKSSVYLSPPSFPYGGAGLVTSARDYDRFLHMLLNGGTLDGAKILSPEAVKLAMSDLLPAGADTSMLSMMTKDSGVRFGFGAGGSLYLTDAPGGPARGTFGWGGAAGTIAWVDPVNKLRTTIMINLLGEGPLRKDSTAAIFADRHQ